MYVEHAGMGLCLVRGVPDSRDTGVLPLSGLTLVVDKVLPPVWHEPPLCRWTKKQYRKKWHKPYVVCEHASIQDRCVYVQV